MVLLQAHQLATSLYLYTFGRGVRDGNRAPSWVSMQMLSNVAIARLAKIRAASTSPGCRRMYLSCSRAENFVVAGNPRLHPISSCDQKKSPISGVGMLKFKKDNTTENHQQAPTVNAPDACAQKKDTSQRRIEAIVVTRCFRLAPETRKGRGTTRSGTRYPYPPDAAWN